MNIHFQLSFPQQTSDDIAAAAQPVVIRLHLLGNDGNSAVLLDHFNVPTARILRAGRAGARYVLHYLLRHTRYIETFPTRAAMATRRRHLTRSFHEQLRDLRRDVFARTVAKLPRYQRAEFWREYQRRMPHDFPRLYQRARGLEAQSAMLRVIEQQRDLLATMQSVIAGHATHIAYLRAQKEALTDRLANLFAARCDCLPPSHPLAHATCERMLTKQTHDQHHTARLSFPPARYATHAYAIED